MTSDKTQLRAAIKKRGSELGFLRLGFVELAGVLPDMTAYDEWLNEGRHGDMAYMAEQRDVRADPSKLLDGVRSAVVVLASYAGHSDQLDGMRVARYAQGDDYHDRMGAALDELTAFIAAETGAQVQSRAAADLLPILERDLARAAGLGWVGKNSMLIDQEIGSFTLIGTILLDIELGSDGAPAPDRCGTCHACIDVCPTNAIVAPGVIDARRCISYLTIELRGPIPRQLRPQIGQHLFGCDLCQSACPWNGRSASPDWAQQLGLSRREVFNGLSPAVILRMTRDEYAAAFRGSAIKRARYDGLLRNAAVVLGNSQDEAHVGTLVEQLWENPEPLVRGHIAWALSRIPWSGSRSALENRRVIETDSYVLEEIRWALSNANMSC